MLSPVASHPADQGNAARLRAVATALAARGVTCEFLYHTLEGMTAAQEAAMRGWWPAFHVNHAERRPEPRFPGTWGLDDWCPESLVKRVAALHRERRYCAVLVNYVWMTGALAGLEDPAPLRILDTHDRFGARRDLALAAGIDPSWYFTTREEEARGLARADLVIAIQPEDAAALAAGGARRVMLLGHLPAAPRFLAGPRPRAEPRIPYGVIASGNPWNLAAVRRLDAALAEAGPSAPPWLLAGSILRTLDPAVLRSRPQLMAEVPDASDFYDAVACVLIPNTHGTGLKVKAAEAVLSGRPVLGTAHGFAGLPAQHPAHAAPDVAALVDFVQRHAAEPGFRAEIALATRQVALAMSAAVAVQQDALAAAIYAGAPAFRSAMRSP
jgi:hypothetical protein